MRSRWVWIFLSIAVVAAVACGVVLTNRSDGPPTAVAATSPAREPARNGDGPAPEVTGATAATGAAPTAEPVAPAAAAAPSVPSTPVSSEDLALLATYGADPNAGPRVASEGDPEVADLPSARDLDLLAKLPGDWPTAMAAAARSTEGLGTPDAARGTFLSGAVSSELYQAWTESLDEPERRGTFTLRRFALTDAPEERGGPLTFVGVGTFVLAATNEATPFIVSTTVTRTSEGWSVTGVSYDRYEGAS